MFGPPRSRFTESLGAFLLLAQVCRPANEAIARPPAPDQIQIGADLAVSSRYIWRGVTRSEATLAGFDGYVGLNAGRHIITGGAWVAGFDFGAARTGDNPAHLGRRVGGEFELWLQLESKWEPLTTKIGTTRDWFPDRDDAASSGPLRDATRLYGAVDIHLSGWLHRLNPSVRAELEPTNGATPYWTATLLWQVKFLPHYFFPLGSAYLDGELGFGPTYGRSTGKSRWDHQSLGLTLPVGTFSTGGTEMDFGLNCTLHRLRRGSWRNEVPDDWFTVGEVGVTLSFVKHRRSEPGESPW